MPAIRAAPATDRRPIPRIAARDLIGAAFLLTAIVFGGGGSTAPFSELVTELAAIAAGAALLLLPRGAVGRAVPGAAWTLGALALALPAVQLVPLPPLLWQALPGRGAEAAALALAGRERGWMPWSIAPAATLASLLSLLSPLAALAFAATASRTGRIALLAAAALGGLVSVLLGALQLADGAGRTWRFYEDNPGFLNGFQANRNAEVDVLLIAALAAAAVTRSLAPRRGGAALASGAGLCLLLLLGALLTGSRTGIALLIPVTVIVAATLDARLLRRRGALAAMLALGLAPLALLALAVPLHNQALLAVSGRFTFARDVRLDLWRDAWSALTGFWPWGSGVGTFVPAFLPAERLAAIDPTFPIRAHDDYLEFLLEGGAAAALVLLAGAVLLARGIVSACARAGRGDASVLAFGISALAIVSLHSFVDYPMRSMALACLAATAAGIVLRSAAGPHPDESRGLGSRC